MSEPMVGFTEVRANCVVCGEEKAVSACWNVTGGWLCAACDSVGRVWAAMMGRNDAKMRAKLRKDFESLESTNLKPLTVGPAGDMPPLTVEDGR